MFTQRHNLNQPGYKVLIFIYSFERKIKIKYQRGLATVAAAPCCSGDNVAKSDLHRNCSKLKDERNFKRKEK